MKVRPLFLVLVLILAFGFSSWVPSVQAQGTGQSYLEKWVGQKVDVQVMLGAHPGWLKGVVLKEIAKDGGIIILYEGKEQYIFKERIISVMQSSN